MTERSSHHPHDPEAEDGGAAPDRPATRGRREPGTRRHVVVDRGRTPDRDVEPDPSDWTYYFPAR